MKSIDDVTPTAANMPLCATIPAIVSFTMFVALQRIVSHRLWISKEAVTIFQREMSYNIITLKL